MMRMRYERSRCSRPLGVEASSPYEQTRNVRNIDNALPTRYVQVSASSAGTSTLSLGVRPEVFGGEIEMSSKIVLAAALAMGFFLSQAQADVEYHYVTDQKAYVAPKAGATVTVNVFLEERVTGASKSFIGPDGGESVSSVAVGILREKGEAKISGGKANPNFGLFSKADHVDAGKDGSILVATFQKFPRAVKFAPGVSRLPVGTVTIVAGPGATTYKLVSGNNANPKSNAGQNGNGTNVNPSLVSLDNDGMINGQKYRGTKNFPFQFTVTGGR